MAVIPTERTSPMNVRPRLVGALLGSLAAFGVAGVGFAGAQETPTTTAPPAAETPSTTPAPGPDRSGHCDHDGGAAPTDAPAATGSDTSFDV